MGAIADKIRKAIFGGDVRDSIADGIEVVEQLREDYDKQVINAGNSNAEIVDARGGHIKLKDRLDKVDSHLAEKANKIDIDASKKYQNTEVSIRRNQFQYFQCVITNPLIDIAYINEPIGIYITFDKEECLGEDYLTVYDENNIEIPFQWEGDKDQKTGIDISRYNDGSLKFGTIWITADLDEGQSKVYTIKVFDSPQKHTYLANVTHEVTSLTEERLISGDTTLTFTEPIGWTMRRVLHKGIDFNSNISASHTSIIDSNQRDVDSANLTVTSIEKSVIGTGVIYLDWITKFSFKDFPDIVNVHKYRLWANGNIEFDMRTIFNADYSSGTINGVQQKINLNEVAGVKNIRDYDNLWIAQESSDIQMMAQCRDYQYLPEKHDVNYYSTEITVKADLQQKLYTGWHMLAGNPRTVPKGAYFSSRYYISFGYGLGNTNIEMLRRMNRIYTRATKYSSEQLQRKFISMAKEYIANMRKWNIINGGNWFYGLQGLESLGVYKICGGDISLIKEARDKLQLSLSTFYSNGTKEGIYNAWLNGKGLEFWGRDFAVAYYLRNEYLKMNDTINAQEMTNLIHNSADAIVDIEVASGGEGRIALRGTLLPNGDNLNAEGAALVALARSLTIEENETRRATYQRIANRFSNSLKFRNKTGYSKDESIIKNPTLHYHSFNLYDLFEANHLQQLNVIMPSIRQYVMEGSTPSGQIREIGFQYTPFRRGSSLTIIYIAGLLARHGKNFSDLEHACNLVEHVLSRSFPSGWHEYPIDGWDYNIGVPESIAAVESQVLIETVLSF